MLHDIINGQEESKFILVTDEVESCGRSLLLNIIADLLQRLSFVIVTCQERPPQFFKTWLPHDVQHKVTFIQPAVACQNDCDDMDGDDVFHKINMTMERLGEDQTVAVVIDSLSMPLFVSDTPSVCRNIHKISEASTVKQVVALLHRDVHDENTHRLLTHQATSVLELSSGPGSTHACHIRHCRHTGKVLKSAEAFRIDSEFYIQDIQPLNKISNSKSLPSDEADKNDPTSQLTFNLSLTSSEKEARSQVVLPYLKDSSKPDDSMSQGRIYYQADDVDDFDEEDPDDDLNI